MGLRKSFGEIIIPKGTILYHTSPTPYTFKKEKPMFFLTFHPSEYIKNEKEYVTKIILKKDISLFFMVSVIKGLRIFPLLHLLVNTPGKNVAKQYDSKLECFVQYLKEDLFDGWFSTIEGKTTIEVALINDPTLFSVLESEQVIWDWTNSYYTATDEFVTKGWGNTYPVLKDKVVLNINKIYKKMMEDYIQNTDDLDGNTFQIILKNSVIHYIDSPQEISKWKC